MLYYTDPENLFDMDPRNQSFAAAKTTIRPYVDTVDR
jgi:hypothetical protein